MRASTFTARLLLVAPLGVLLSCAGDNGGGAASGLGGSKGTGGNSNVTVGGTVSTGGVASGGASAHSTGGTVANATGGTTASATGGTKANATGGTTASATGGSKANATGGTKANATGGTKASATGGTTGNATGGTTQGSVGGTTGSATGGTRATATGGTNATATGGTKATATGGATGTAGSTGYPIGNTPVPSSGCGKALPSAYKAGADTTFKDMTSAGIKREYIVYVPTGYDSSKPYRLVFAWHCMGSSDTGAVSSGYYGGKQQDTGKTTIFVAPQGYTDTMPWRSDDKDHTFFDDMLKLFKSDLCIDESRVFSIGFSFGGMETYSLSVDHQKDLRAGVGIAPANYNIYVTPNKTHAPIAWMQTTGVNDTTCPWVNGTSTTQGSKYIAIEHGTDNGCTVPNPIPTWTSGNHLCVDFTGCKAEYPTKVCTFNGPHTDTSNEGGSNWIYTEAWKFMTQF